MGEADRNYIIVPVFVDKVKLSNCCYIYYFVDLKCFHWCDRVKLLSLLIR